MAETLDQIGAPIPGCGFASGRLRAPPGDETAGSIPRSAGRMLNGNAKRGLGVDGMHRRCAIR